VSFNTDKIPQRGCMVGPVIKSHCSIKKLDPACLCRSGFTTAYDKCIKKKCAPQEYLQASTGQQLMCAAVIPSCALNCVVNMPQRSACGLNLYCMCRPSFDEQMRACLKKDCDNQEDIEREVRTKDSLCDLIPPECAVCLTLLYRVIPKPKPRANQDFIGWLRQKGCPFNRLRSRRRSILYLLR
jgi:hypothetical protein